MASRLRRRVFCHMKMQTRFIYDGRPASMTYPAPCSQKERFATDAVFANPS